MRLKKSLAILGSLLLAAVSVVASADPPPKTTEKITVITSYPQEVVSQFERAFEHAYPQYRLEILWRQSRDAMSYLHAQHPPADVYWTPSQRNFAVLAKEGAFSKLDIDLDGLPDFVGGYRIADPEKYYVATEIAGFGIAFNPGEFQHLGISAPQDWKDLALPALHGRVALPIPSKVGYAPMMIDTLLQGYGWDAGWQIVRQIAVNAKLVDAGATFVSEDVGSGRMAAGATIDFFAISAIANGKPLQFVYPEKVGYSPAHIAIFKESANPDGAKAFATFVLSAEGQKLLFHPDIRKLPIRPSVYAAKPAGYFDPFQAAARSSYPYDLDLGIARQELVSAMFDAVITRPHPALVTTWETIQAAMTKRPDDQRLQQARQEANWLPVSATESRDITLQRQFAQHGDTKTLEKTWEDEATRHYVKATALARAVLESQ